jgi:hypothetical protein
VMSENEIPVTGDAFKEHTGISVCCVCVRAKTHDGEECVYKHVFSDHKYHYQG